MNVLLTIVALLVSQYAAAQAQPPGGLRAFPGAEGSAAELTGGRGGAVFMVTNRNNTGSGSLRACIEATGPRTCIFRTAGDFIIGLLNIQNRDLTIAGQTAPGGGVTLRGDNRGGNMLQISDPNIIIRYIRIRKGFNDACVLPRGGPAENCGLNLVVFDGNVMIDHITASWNQEENVDFKRGPNVTLSYSILSEGLGPSHATSLLMAGTNVANATAAVNMDVHHNLISTMSHRNPTWRMRSGRFVNNIVYNIRRFATRFSGGTLVDLINNRYKAGPIRPSPPFHAITATECPQTNSPPGEPSFFISGNTSWDLTDPNGNQALNTGTVPGCATGGDSETGGPIAASRFRSTPLANTKFPITAVANSAVEATVLPTVGASRRLDCNGNWVSNRDAVDTRIINEYKNGTGRSSDVTNEDQVGGYPALAAGTPCPDADLDGMPDAFESARPGLSNSNPSDRNGDLDNDGYTNLEEYLDGIR